MPPCSAYAVVTEYHDSCNVVDVKYYTFNPYSYGKEICVGFGLGPFCFGQNVTLGNHVGDWERLEMRFENGLPTDLYLNAHSFGAFYTFTAGVFTFVRRAYTYDVRGGWFEEGSTKRIQCNGGFLNFIIEISLRTGGN